MKTLVDCPCWTPILREPSEDILGRLCHFGIRLFLTPNAMSDEIYLQRSLDNRGHLPWKLWLAKR